jgi:pilus assembly protein Flp/PilA
MLKLKLFLAKIKNHFRNDKHPFQGLVEYALILFLVAVVVIAVLVLIGPQIGDVFSNIKSNLGKPTP